MTSGGDAPGMNAAVRGAVRAALAAGAEVWGIYEGYEGLVGGHLERLGADDVSHIIQLGGTFLGTARSAAFREAGGRRRAAASLLARGIDRLLVVGGDGSLTGADCLRDEWAQHLVALVEESVITEEVAAAHPELRVAGLVGSIDNDLVGTDTTIGYDSALHRIVDALDTLTATARSHQRSFVVEVMGRHCGYLALAAALCSDADAVLVPEAPPEDWRSHVVTAVRRGRERGKRKSTVLLAEGARDRGGRPITAEEVRDAMQAETGVETRITSLGHVQRGGTPSAFDRIVPTLLGHRAVAHLLGEAPPSVVLTTAGASLEERPLAAAIAATRAVATAVDAQRFDDAVRARGHEFASLLDLEAELRADASPADGARRLLVAHVGAPAPGMNAAVRTFARLVRQRGLVPLAMHDGLEGILRGEPVELSWLDTEDLNALGGTVLGSSRWWPRVGKEVSELDRRLSEHRIDGVLLVGGYEALRTAAQIESMGLPAAVVPATISNNVPGTEWSVGSDTAANAICEAVDRVKQSAIGSRRRVFVVEVMGRRCGYLAAISGIGTGAEVVYTHEEGIDLARLSADAASLCGAFDEGRQVGLILVADAASDAYDAHAIARIFEAEGEGRFDTRVCVLGHLQQGGRPSPRDRLLAVRLCARAVEHLVAGAGAVVVGLAEGRVVTTGCLDALEASEARWRRPVPPPHASLVAELRRAGQPFRR